jgi:transcription initiation factor IIE alpha subunit
MKTNNEKILDALEEKESEVSTTELAESTGINVKNISRYLKDLEKEGLIKRRTVQDGRKRFVYINLITSCKDNTGRNSGKMITSRKDQNKIKQKSKSLEGKHPDKLSDRDLITGRNSGKMITSRKDQNKIKKMEKRLERVESAISSNGRLEIATFVKDNLPDLITAVDQYLRTYNNPKRTIKPGGIVDRRNNRMIKVKRFLEGLSNGQ